MDFRVTGGVAAHATGAAQGGNSTATADYDLAAFPDGTENIHYARNKWKNRLSRTVSLDALWHSLGTIYFQHDPYSQDLTALGFNPLRDYRKIVHDEGYHATYKQRDRENSALYGRGPKKVFLDSRHGSPAFDTFRDIVRFCDDRGIRLIVVIYPYHAHLLEIVRAAGLWPQFEDWKRELVTIVETAPGGTTSLWDFSGYTGFSTENVPTEREKTKEVKWYWEAGHFKKELGDLILARVFDSVSASDSLAPRFGTKLTAGNIDEHLADIRLHQARYQSDYPTDVADLKTLVGSNLPKIQGEP